MPELSFSIHGPHAEAALRALGDRHAAPGGTRGLPASHTARWTAASGEPISAEFPVRTEAGSLVEYPEPDGRIQSASVPPALSFSAELPPSAAALEVRLGDNQVAKIPVEALAARSPALPAPSSRRFGGVAASFVVPVFSERFADEGKFFGAVLQLHSWVMAQPPFNDPAVGAHLAFDAHFWPSDPNHGLFGTDDSRNQSERLFYGDRELARRLLSPWTAGRSASLILIDSQLRGGAGGQPGYSAWTSICAKPGERWEAVCLHEVGHGLGLADEYLDSQRQGEWPATFEPNVSRDPHPSLAPWRMIATVGDAPAPTWRIGATGVATGTIGTFQGARYRQDLYRACEHCLMKETKSSFCAACQAHIRTRLAAP
jgi:hypothetical protein